MTQPEHSTKVLDRRVVERYVHRGIVSQKDYDKHMKSLPDLAEQSEKLTSELTPVAGVGPGR